MKPKVSVIIPVYNTEAYFEATLRSIAEQTLRELEIIVVDDGSTDGSRALAERAAASDARIRVVTQSNSGQSAARNRGMEIAEGEFIYLMDSDDLLERDALERCYDKCVQNALDFVLFDADVFGDTDRFPLGFDYYRARYLEDRTYGGPELLDLLIERRIYRSSVCLNLMRAEFVRRAGLRFRPGIIHEDELFAAQLYLHAARVGAIDRAFFKRRVRGASTMTSSYSRANVDGYLTAAASLKEYAAKQDPARRKLVEKTIRYFLNPAVYKASGLPWQERFRLLGILLRRHPRSVRPKNIAVLLLKAPLSQLRKR